MNESLLGLLRQWSDAGRPCVDPIGEVVGPDRRVCPSYPDGHSGRPFARRDPSGRLIFEVRTAPIEVNTPQADRYFGPCMTTRCVHWSDHCSLGAVLARATLEDLSDSSTVSPASIDCPLVDTCRWRAENGVMACRACVEVEYFVDG